MNWNPTPTPIKVREDSDRYQQLRKFIRAAERRFPKIRFAIVDGKIVPAGPLAELERLAKDPEWKVL